MSDTDYGFASRLLHRVALGSRVISQTLFDLEKALYGVDHENDGRHLFITGLARSGTTVLLRALYETGKFRSLTYRDMPFVLMPVTWSKISRAFRAQNEDKVRAHGDRILVNYDSPEAFDEVFWRTYCYSDYILPDYVKPHSPDKETIKSYQAYVSQVIASGDNAQIKKYLCKNNNNVLRLNTISKAFPDSLILIMFRDPVQQSCSLLRQHKLFTEKHKKDPFSEQYMSWLGHYEFGNGHKPFRYKEKSSSDDEYQDPFDINYWMSLWCNTYEYIASTIPENSMLVSYENLCKQSESILERIMLNVREELEPGSLTNKFSSAKISTPEGINNSLKERAVLIYEKLDALSFS